MMDVSAILPDLPPELDEAGKDEMRAKAQRQKPEHDAFREKSDEWVANRVRMLMRNDLWHEPICCAGRDRIMRLSLENARLREQRTEARMLLDEVQARDAGDTMPGRIYDFLVRTKERT